MLVSSEEPGPPQPESDGGARNLPEVLQMAQTLDPKDRTRLIARLWQSLPPKNQAAITTFVLENARHPGDVKPSAANFKSVAPLGKWFWGVLFDPAKTSDLYSAPRRFDLATIFVVTAAYSLLFGAMTALDYYFGAPIKVMVGLLVTAVAVSQAYFQHVANPRGVSIITGSVALSVILAVMGTIQRNWFPEPLLIVVVLYGIIGGAIAGYLSGVMVGGVFLIADALRKKLVRRSMEESSDRPVDNVD